MVNTEFLAFAKFLKRYCKISNKRVLAVWVVELEVLKVMEAMPMTMIFLFEELRNRKILLSARNIETITQPLKRSSSAFFVSFLAALRIRM